MPDIIPNVVVSMTSQPFTMPREFKSVFNGMIYIGKIDTDPTIPANQIQVYLENEDGSYTPMPQPIRTNAGGYPVYNGKVSKFVTVEGHSMLIQDANGVQLFYFPNVLKYDPDQLRLELSGPSGFNLVGEIQSISGFFGLTGQDGDKVLLKGWYSGAGVGGGIFDYSSSTNRSSHDGGVVISPDVPYSGDSDISSFINGIGGGVGVGCWVRRDVNEVTGDMYGLSGNPTSTASSPINATASLKKMALKAGEIGCGIVVPANPIRITSSVSIPMHQRDGGKVSYFKGVSEKESIIQVLASGTTSSAYGIVFDGSLSVFSSFPVSDFAINSVNSDGSRADWSGFGVKFNKVIRLDWQRCNVDGFEIGTNMTDTLYSTLNTVRFSYNKTGLQGRLGELTGANAVNATRCDFNNNAEFGIEMQHAHAWLLESCTFEGNGGKSYANATPITFAACAQYALIGGAGQVAATFEGCYFENNKGLDISFYINRNLNQIMNINNSIFNYNLDTVSASRILVQSNQSDLSNGVQAILNMSGNGFLNTGVATTSAFKEVQFAVPSTFGVSHLVFNDYGNKTSMTSPYSGLEKVQRNFAGGVTARVNVSSTGAFSLSQNVVSVTKSGVGVYVINFTCSVANSLPNVMLFGGSGRYATFTRTSDYILTISTFNNTGSAVDLDFMLTVA